jgi:hypothetical protein
MPETQPGVAPPAQVLPLSGESGNRLALGASRHQHRHAALVPGNGLHVERGPDPLGDADGQVELLTQVVGLLLGTACQVGGPLLVELSTLRLCNL